MHLILVSILLNAPLFSFLIAIAFSPLIFMSNDVNHAIILRAFTKKKKKHRITEANDLVITFVVHQEDSVINKTKISSTFIKNITYKNDTTIYVKSLVHTYKISNDTIQFYI